MYKRQVLNLVAVLRGTERVEVFGRELSHDSIRRSNATVVMSFGVLLPVSYTHLDVYKRQTIY